MPWICFQPHIMHKQSAERKKKVEIFGGESLGEKVLQSLYYFLGIMTKKQKLTLQEETE